MPDDVNELQKEWRAIVLSKLNSLEATQSELRKDIADMKGKYPTWNEFLELRKEVETLKEFKSKWLGAIAACSVLGSVIGFVVSLLLKVSH